MTPEQELALRREQYEARKDQIGYKANVTALLARIAVLEGMVG